MLGRALYLVRAYVRGAYAKKEWKIIDAELRALAAVEQKTEADSGCAEDISYARMQEMLSTLNEKESIRKSRGVYYTPGDVVQFIVAHAVKAAYGKLAPDNINDTSYAQIPHRSFALQKTVFDPTCGAGEFLLCALELKFDLLKAQRMTRALLQKTVATVAGNDINKESVALAKLRLFLCALHRYGSRACTGLAAVLNGCFTTLDYVFTQPQTDKKYDIIVGNPPYVELAKRDALPQQAYGNIYANVLRHASAQLAAGGSIGFVIPLSYMSTPRMRRLREELFLVVPMQYLLSYADRPDSLFGSVHQKLCILIGKNKKTGRCIYTGNYQYWYREERDGLFARTCVVRNRFYTDSFIPKLGTAYDCSIYRKITDKKTTRSVYRMSRTGTEAVCLNRREAFWMKAYRRTSDDPEYKLFYFNTPGEADYCYCLLHSSLFWWYWIAVSDCWHVSRELNGFRAPAVTDYTRATLLAAALADRLEQTKEYVGTKQTAYEYKHKACIAQIHAIDDYVNALYGLSEKESAYIKNFAYRYRTGGGVKKDEGG